MGAWARPSVLSVVFMVDALLSIGFGMVSYFLPTSTYATVIDLSDSEQSVDGWRSMVASRQGQDVAR